MKGQNVAGQGGSCRFGMRGQELSSGPGVMKGFEGGQMLLYCRNSKWHGIVGGSDCTRRKGFWKCYSLWTVGVIQCILLSGVPPILVGASVLKSRIDFDLEQWPSKSDSAKDLIRKMLCSNPAEHLTAHQVLCHPSICKSGVVPDRAFDPAVLSRLKNLFAMNKLEKLALWGVPSNLNEDCF